MENFITIANTDSITGEVTVVKQYLTPEEIAIYQAQEAQANKQKAKDLLAQTDWTTIPDVADPALSNPYLTNQAEFITYRNQVRPIAINPVAGNLTWPTQPTPSWS
jgi:hypothetical protein